MHGGWSFSLRRCGGFGLLYDDVAFPERTKGLVIYGGYARRTWAPDYPWATKPETRERFFRDIEQNWRSFAR